VSCVSDGNVSEANTLSIGNSHTTEQSAEASIVAVMGVSDLLIQQNTRRRSSSSSSRFDSMVSCLFCNV